MMKTGVLALLLAAVLGGSQMPTLAQSERPRVLFDEYHSERNSISLEQARILDPAHPEWYSYDRLRATLESWFLVERNVALLTEPLLGSVDVLVLAVPQTSFTGSEAAAVRKFVEEGGGLLLLGDAFPPESLNSIAAAFGLRFLPGVIASHEPEWDPQSYLAGNMDPQHPITRWSPPFTTNWGTALEISGDGTVLVTAGPETWQDVNEDGTQNAGEQGGPFVLAVALTVGEGRVVAISDNAFQDSMIDGLGNRSLITRSIDWLSQSAPRTNTAALGSASDLASIVSVAVHPYGRAGDPTHWPALFTTFHTQFLDRAPLSNSVGLVTDELAARWAGSLSIPAATFLSEDPQDMQGWSLHSNYYDFLSEDRLWRDLGGSVARDPFENSAARSISGAILTSEGGDFVVMSESSPWWKAFQQESIDWALSLGLDAINIDLPDRVPVRLSPDFSEWAVAAFQDYLAAHYDSPTLASWGVGGLGTFDIGQYISAQAAARGVLATPGEEGEASFYMEPRDALLADPLVRAFHEFEYSSHIAYFGSLVDYAHAAGAAQDQFVPFFGNLWVGWSGSLLQSANPTVLLGQTMDLIQIEMEPAIPPAQRIQSAVKLARAMGQQQKPVWIIPAAFYGFPFEPSVLPKDPMCGLLKLFLAEAYAAGGILEIDLGGWPGFPDGRGLFVDPSGQPIPELVSYMDFVWENRQLLLNRRPSSNVALVYSVSSFLWHDVPLFGIYCDEERQVFAACARALEEAHIQYDVVILGHPGLWDDSCELASLPHYAAVVLPDVSCISDPQVTALTSFVRAGGTLVSVGLPDRNEEYELRTHPAFGSLDQDPGQGRLVTLTVQSAKAYYARIGASNAGFDQLARPLTGTQIIATTAPGTVGLNAWRTATGLTLHLVNYAYSVATDAVVEASGITLRIDLAKLGLSKPTEVTAYSPDSDSTEQLAFSMNGPMLEITVPRLKIWTIVVIP